MLTLLTKAKMTPKSDDIVFACDVTILTMVNYFRLNFITEFLTIRIVTARVVKSTFEIRWIVNT